MALSPSRTETRHTVQLNVEMKTHHYPVMTSALGGDGPSAGCPILIWVSL